MLKVCYDTWCANRPSRHHAAGRNAGSTYEEVKSHVRQSVQCSGSSVHYSTVNGSYKLMGLEFHKDHL